MENLTATVWAYTIFDKKEQPYEFLSREKETGVILKITGADNQENNVYHLKKYRIQINTDAGDKYLDFWNKLPDEFWNKLGKYSTIQTYRGKQEINIGSNNHVIRNTPVDILYLKKKII